VEVAGPIDILHLQNSFLGVQCAGWIRYVQWRALQHVVAFAVV